MLCANGEHLALQVEYQGLRAEMRAAREYATALKEFHSENFAAVQQRYEGLSKQLLQETAQQRQALQQEQGRIASQLKFAERRIATLEEARAQLDELMRAAIAKTPAPRQRAPASAAKSSGKRDAPPQGKCLTMMRCIDHGGTPRSCI